jgi:ABC-type Fe3+-hydroxamate transport system substrate-binding protein
MTCVNTASTMNAFNATAASHAIRRWMLAFVPLMALAVTLALTGCEKSGGAGAAASLAVHDPKNPRIVVLSPALAVIVRDLGLEKAIVGRHGWDLALDPAIRVCGDQAGVDFEALLTARPTHVVLQWGERELPPRLVELASTHGWTLLNHNPLALDDIPAITRSLANTFAAAIELAGSRAKADALVASVAAACESTSEVPWNGTVLLLASTSPPAALGPASWHGQILTRLGATPAIASGGPYQTLDVEDILRLAPGGIVLIQPRGTGEPAKAACNTTSDFDEADLHTRLGVLSGFDLAARSSGRVALIDDPLALTPSSSIVEFRRRLREILEAWDAASGK